MGILVLVIIIALIPATIASLKGRSFIGWWIYGFLLFIVALPHALIIKPDQSAIDERRLSAGDLRKCPHCAELVKSEAKVCRYCQREIVGATT